MACAAVAAGVSAFGATGSQAALLFTIEAVGPNVVVTGSGSAITTGLTPSVPQGSYTRVIVPSVASVSVGPYGFVQRDSYAGVTGPAAFGTGGGIGSFEGTGTHFGLSALNATTFFLQVPPGYVSGAPLFGTAVYTGSTFATLGVTPGTYVYNFGSGPTADTLTIQVGAAAIPEPASFGLLALAGSFLLGRRRGR